MTHGVPCNAYSFVKKGQIRIDRRKLEKTKIPNSPILGKLKEGKDIVYGGKKYRAKDLTFKEDDLKISFVLDTSTNSQVVKLVKNSDVLVCETSYSSELSDKAKEFHHLTSKQAGEIAKKSGSKKLIITHLSQRHERETGKILAETKKVFKNTELAEDLKVVEV